MTPPKFTAFGWYWLAWFLAGFMVPEVYWIINAGKNTLSDNFWAMERMDIAHPFDLAEWTPLHYFFGAVMLVFVVWLFFHLVFGLFG